MGARSSKSASRSPAKAKPAAATPNKARDATVAFGAGHDALPFPIGRRIMQYLQSNC